MAFSVEIKVLPDNHDPNSYLVEYGPQKLAQFIQTGSRQQTATEPPESSQTPLAGDFVIACGVRQYRVMSLDKGSSKLRATIRLEHAGKLHIDSFDLYTAVTV